MSVEVVIGSTVIGAVDAVSSSDGTVSVVVPIAGPMADVPAEIRIRRSATRARSAVLASTNVNLAAARSAGIWRATVRADDRTIDLSGYAALAIGVVHVAARVGERRIGRVEVLIGITSPRPAGVPFGVAGWTTDLRIGPLAVEGGASSVLVEASWSRSAAGPAGSTSIVVAFGDDRGD